MPHYKHPPSLQSLRFILSLSEGHTPSSNLRQKPWKPVLCCLWTPAPCLPSPLCLPEKVPGMTRNRVLTEKLLMSIWKVLSRVYRAGEGWGHSPIFTYGCNTWCPPLPALSESPQKFWIYVTAFKMSHQAASFLWPEQGAEIAAPWALCHLPGETSFSPSSFNAVSPQSPHVFAWKTGVF